jgi:site-specific recombinase XerD
MGNPLWHVRFTHQGQRHHESTGCTAKSKAAKKAAEIYAKVVGGAGLGGRRQVGAAADLEELLSLWLVEVEDTRSPEWHTTLEIYASAHWLPRWKLLGDVNTPAIQKYIGERLRAKGTGGRKLSPVTLAKELSGLRRFLKWCKRNGHLAEVPTWEAPAPKSDYEPVYLSRDQMLKVLAELPSRESHHHHLPVRAFFTVMWATSFRLGTMARLRWEDVNLTDRTITVHCSQDKKRLARVVPLTEEAVAELQAIAPGVGLVFSKKNYRASLSAAARRAGISEEVVKRLGNHSIRHSRLTDLASRSKNIAAIQHMAGHKDLASTMRYIHGSLDNARDLLAEAEGGVKGSQVAEAEGQGKSTEVAGTKDPPAGSTAPSPDSGHILDTDKKKAPGEGG